MEIFEELERLNKLIDEFKNHIMKVAEEKSFLVDSDPNKEKSELISENIANITDNVKKFDEGSSMYILTCMNSYEFFRRAFIALVKKNSCLWSDLLEEDRQKILDAMRKVRFELVERHNSIVPENCPEEKIEHIKEPKNQIDKLIHEFIDWGLNNYFKKYLDDIDLDSLNDDEMESYYGSLGVWLAKFGEDGQESIDILKKGHDMFPDSIKISWNLALMLEKLGLMDQAKPIFNRLAVQSVEPEQLLILARIYYLWDQVEDGLKVMDKLLKQYHEIGICDPHFLMIRGFPTYSSVFGTYTVFAKMARKPQLAQEELDYASKNLENVNLQGLEKKMHAFLDGDLSESLTSYGQESQMDGWQGYLSIVEALIKSRQQDSLQGAVDILSSIEFSENDHKWLGDVILLGKAEASYKFKAYEEETAFQKEFLKRQPMLFEPYHVFNFCFDEYQERLKRAYQNSTRKPTEGFQLHFE